MWDYILANVVSETSLKSSFLAYSALITASGIRMKSMKG